jgi:glycogen phosphorylase
MSTITPAVAAATSTPREALSGDTLGMDAAALKHSVLRHLEYTLAELPRHVDSAWEPYHALALAVRDRLIQRWIRTQDEY